MPTSREQRHTEHLPQAKQVERKGFANTIREKLAMAGTWFEQLRSGGNAIKNSELMQQAAFRTVQDRLNHLNAEVAAQASAHNVRPEKYLTEAETERQRLQALLGKAEKNYQKVEAEVEAEHIRLIEQKIEELHTAIAKAARTPGITQEKYLQETQEDQIHLLALLKEADTYYYSLANKFEEQKAAQTLRGFKTELDKDYTLDKINRFVSGIQAKRNNFSYIQKNLAGLAQRLPSEERVKTPETSLPSPEILKIKEQLNTRLANLTEQIVTLSKSSKPEEKSAAQKLETEAVILGAAISAMEQGNYGPALNYLQQFPAAPPAKTPREEALSEIFSSVPLKEPTRLNNEAGSGNILSSVPLADLNQRVSELANRVPDEIQKLSNTDLFNSMKEAQNASFDRLLSLQALVEKNSIPELSPLVQKHAKSIQDMSVSIEVLTQIFQTALLAKERQDVNRSASDMEYLDNVISMTGSAIQTKEASIRLEAIYEQRKQGRAKVASANSNKKSDSRIAA